MWALFRSASTPASNAMVIRQLVGKGVRCYTARRTFQLSCANGEGYPLPLVKIGDGLVLSKPLLWGMTV
jgi:hypothetical protein